MAQGFGTYTAVVAASGAATISIRTKSSESWIVRQVAVEMNATAPSSAACAIRKNSYMVTPVIAFADSAAGEPPIELTPNDVMTVEWTGCTPGAACKATIFFDRIGLGR